MIVVIIAFSSINNQFADETVLLKQLELISVFIFIASIIIFRC